MDNTPAGSDPSSRDEIRIPTDLLREVAAEILAEVGQALALHDQTWHAIQAWIDESSPTYGTADLGSGMIDPHVPHHLNEVLQPHAQRLRASYEWQISVAQALFAAVDAVETTEQGLANGFSDTGANGV